MKTIWTSLSALLVICLTAAPGARNAQAQSPETAQPQPRPAPCAELPAFRDFDFWIGDWEVRDGDGKVVGTNRISRQADGCVLVEEWKSRGGGSGVSVNYYDPSTAEWVQVWNGSGGTQLTIRGGLDDAGIMRLGGRLYYVGTQKTVRFRGLWEPLADGRVRQYFEQSADDGGTWQPWFEGFYSRRRGTQ